MSKIAATFSERLREILELKNIKAIDLAKLSGISRGAISSYLSGRWKAKQNNIYLIANALNVNEAWLMGYDVPMESTRPKPITYTIHNNPLILAEAQDTYGCNSINNKQKEIMDHIQGFSDEQLDKVIEYILFLKSR